MMQCNVHYATFRLQVTKNLTLRRKLQYLLLNPIRSGGALKAPPPIFCSHAFNIGAALLCVGDFSQKIV